jgi:hypothetical protein
MSFRQQKSEHHRDSRSWEAWLAKRARSLKAINLPPSVTLSRAHWVDFIQSGYFEMHPEANDEFSFHQLSREQMSGLLKVLEASPEFASEPLVRWLRQRIAK